MADPPADSVTGVGADRLPPSGAPKAPPWAKVFGAVNLVVVVAVLAVLVVRGPHRPGMHGGGGVQAPGTSVVEPVKHGGSNSSGERR